MNKSIRMKITFSYFLTPQNVKIGKNIEVDKTPWGRLCIRKSNLGDLINNRENVLNAQ